jgi:hypothetical protein
MDRTLIANTTIHLGKAGTGADKAAVDRFDQGEETVPRGQPSANRLPERANPRAPAHPELKWWS